MRFKNLFFLQVSLLALIFSCKSYLHEPQFSLKVEFPDTRKAQGSNKLFQMGGSSEAPWFVNKVVVKLSSGSSYTSEITHLRDSTGILTDFEFTDVPFVKEINVEVAAYYCRDDTCTLLYSSSGVHSLSGSRENSEVRLILNASSGTPLDGIILELGTLQSAAPGSGNIAQFGSDNYHPYCFDIGTNGDVGVMFFVIGGTMFSYGFYSALAGGSYSSFTGKTDFSANVKLPWKQSCKYYNGSLIAPVISPDAIPSPEIFILSLTKDFPPDQEIIFTQESGHTIDNAYLDFGDYWILAWQDYDPLVEALYSINYKFADNETDLTGLDPYTSFGSLAVSISNPIQPFVKVVDSNKFAIGFLDMPEAMVRIADRSAPLSINAPLSGESVLSGAKSTSRYSGASLNDGEYFISAANDSSLYLGIYYQVYKFSTEDYPTYSIEKTGVIQADPDSVVKHSEIFNVGDNKAVVLWSESTSIDGVPGAKYKIYASVIDIYNLTFSEKKLIAWDANGANDYFSPRAVHYKDGITLVAYYSNNEIHFKWFLF